MNTWAAELELAMSLDELLLICSVEEEYLEPDSYLDIAWSYFNHFWTTLRRWIPIM